MEMSRKVSNQEVQKQDDIGSSAWFTTKAPSEECMCNSAHVLFLDWKGWAWRDRQRGEERLMSNVKISVTSTLAREVGLGNRSSWDEPGIPAFIKSLI